MDQKIELEKYTTTTKNTEYIFCVLIASIKE